MPLINKKECGLFLVEENAQTDMYKSLRSIIDTKVRLCYASFAAWRSNLPATLG
jgi:hypothetical protein